MTSPHKTRKDLANEYGVSVRTVDRWKAQGVLPKPKRIGERPFWTDRQIRQAERMRTRKWNRAEMLRARKAAVLKQHKAELEFKKLSAYQPTLFKI